MHVMPTICYEMSGKAKMDMWRCIANCAIVKGGSIMSDAENVPGV